MSEDDTPSHVELMEWLDDIPPDRQNRPKHRGRGLSFKSRRLIQIMAEIAEPIQPITGRGIGYKLFVAGEISSMSGNEMQRVYRALKQAREQDMIPWSWVVDEGRNLEKRPTWSDPKAFLKSALRLYKREFWDQQPVHVEVWSEKGTVRGVLAPVLNEYGVGFRVLHGFAGATTVYDIAQDNLDDDRELIVLYIGDYDPSGMYMSEADLPVRIKEYGGDHVTLRRIALTDDDTTTIGLPLSFPARDKRKDMRYEWFTRIYGNRCWELDAMDPNELRERVENEILALIEPEAWSRCLEVNKAEQASLQTYFSGWKGAAE